MSLIRDAGYSWPVGQLTTVRLTPLTLPAGRVVTDFIAFVLTIRADPLWPRSGPASVAAESADPVRDGWAVAAAAAGSLDDEDVPTFTFTVPGESGLRRYAVDVWGTLPGGRVQLVAATWLTAGARVTA